ncbi:hypothetical protein RFI_07917, partial [Reticulomyxa filosa]
NNVFKPLFLCSSGLLIYVSTGSFIGNSFIWLNDEERRNTQITRSIKSSEHHQEDYSWRLQVIYFLRALLAFFAQVEHQLGAWEIFDSYMFQPTICRDVIYFIIGVIGLQWSKALVMNACITPFNVAIQPNGLPAIYNIARQSTKLNNLEESKGCDDTDVSVEIHKFDKHQHESDRDNEEEIKQGTCPIPASFFFLKKKSFYFNTQYYQLITLKEEKQWSERKPLKKRSKTFNIFACTMHFLKYFLSWICIFVEWRKKSIFGICSHLLLFVFGHGKTINFLDLDNSDQKVSFYNLEN